MSLLRRAIVPVILIALVVTAAFTLFGGGDTKTLTAYFPRTISLYEGSDVRVLGVAIGKVDTVTPEGTQVKVTMHYDAGVEIPAQAQAVVVSPSIVGDRYVQLTPAYKSGDVLADNTILPQARTAVPLELDQIYSSLDRLTVAIGPDGANKNGALNDLLKVTAANFAGQGDNFHTAIKNFANLNQTLDVNKKELFGSAAELQKFISKLADNDKTVRGFNASLSRVSNVLAGDRQELSSALKNLAVALDSVGSFVRDNRSQLSRNISGLNRVAKVLVNQRDAIEESLHVAPLALNNLALTYNPQAGTLDTNANAGLLAQELTTTPTAFLCSLVASNDPNGTECSAIKKLGLPRTGPFGAGSGSFYGDQYDPSLGGILGGSR